MKTTYMLNNMPLEIDYTFIDDDKRYPPRVEIEDIFLYGHSIDVYGLYWNGQELDEFLAEELLKENLPCEGVT